MFTGLSAFPLTPIHDSQVDEAAFVGLVERLVDVGMDSITVLGSTGGYAYLDHTERARVARLAVQHAADVPVLVGVGAVRTEHVLRHVEAAQEAGVAGVLLAPVSYTPLTEDDVLGLYADVTAELSVPLVVYDNPATTHFSFTDELYQAVAALPGVASIKIPGVPAAPSAAEARVDHLHEILPRTVSLGVSGDPSAATGLRAGCEAWYSVIAGTLPQPALEIMAAARDNDHDRAAALSTRLQPLWDLFARHGSLRVIAAVAETLGLISGPSLPRPIRGLSGPDRREVVDLVAAQGW